MKYNESAFTEIPLAPLSAGDVAKVSIEDAPRLSFRKWSRRLSEHTTYAYSDDYSTGQRKKIMLHRAILNAPDHLQVDHVDRDGLNNTRKNLRLATPSQNHMNAAKRMGTSSRFKGVSFDSSRDKWKARLNIDGMEKFLGRFDSEEDAALAYNEAAVEYFGEFARLNQIQI